MVIRLQLVLLACLAWIATVVAQTGSTLQFTLYHQLVQSESAGDILPRGVIKYDSKTNTAVYEAQAEMVDVTLGKGVYRIGFYDAQRKHLSPATFTQLGTASGPVTEEITLYLSPDNIVYQISYTLKPSTLQGTAIHVIPDRLIPYGPEPVLNTPVVVNPDGIPPVEEKEKTFIEKYWIYLLPLVLIIVTSGGSGGEAGGE